MVYGFTSINRSKMNSSQHPYENATVNPVSLYGARDWFLPWLLVSLTICVLGTVFYVALFIIIYSEKSLRTGTGLLLLHLILTEALLATIQFYLVFVDVKLSETRADSNDKFCYYTMFSYWVILFSSNWSAAFLSINRLVAVAKPHFYQYLTTKTVRAVMIVGSWMFGFGATVPVGLGIGGRFDALPEVFRICGLVRTEGLWSNGGLHVYDGVATMGMYLPLALTLTVYIGLFTVMRSRVDKRTLSNEEQRGTAMHTGTSTVRRRLGMARMLFASSVWYCICFYPIPIIMVVSPEVFVKYPFTLLWLRTLLFAGFSTKPILYCCLSADYRNGLKKLFRCLVRKPDGANAADPPRIIRPSLAKIPAVGSQTDSTDLRK